MINQGPVRGFRDLKTKISKTTPCNVADACRCDVWRIVQNHLTRRANHRHIFIVATIKPAPEHPPRAFESDDTLSGNTPPSAPNLAAAANRIG